MHYWEIPMAFLGLEIGRSSLRCQSLLCLSWPWAPKQNGVLELISCETNSDSSTLYSTWTLTPNLLVILNGNWISLPWWFITEGRCQSILSPCSEATELTLKFVPPNICPNVLLKAIFIEILRLLRPWTWVTHESIGKHRELRRKIHFGREGWKS